MKILVTGSGGFVGSTLCGQLLEMGYKVRAMDNFHKGNCDALIPYCSNGDFEFFPGDITCNRDIEKAMRGVDEIIHLAGIIGAPACSKNPTLSKSVNVYGTKNIIKNKPKDVVMFFASTGSVYGKVDNVCTEDTPTNPQSEYGIHKLEAEKIVLDAENTFVYRFATGFGVSPCMRVDLLINDLTYKAAIDKLLVIFQPDFKRTFIHVREMGSSFVYGLHRLDKTSEHRVFNVGSPANNTSKREMAELIKEKTGCTVLYEEFAKDPDQRSYSVDFSRFKEAVKWEPTISIESGINELLNVTPVLQMKRSYV